MAKKKTTTEKSEKKQKKEPARYSEFISTVMLKKISDNLPWIREVCEKYKGIEPVPLEIWKKLDELVIEISKEAKRCGEDGYHYHTEPIKRATYNISHKVREMQRKDMILKWAEQWSSSDQEYNIHVCHQIYLDIAIWLTENAKTEKVENKKED